MTKMQELLNHLAIAFGGHSQYSLGDVGRAIAGQINNNGWAGSPEGYAAEAAQELQEIWGGQGATLSEDSAAVLAGIQDGIQEVLAKYSRVGRHPGY